MSPGVLHNCLQNFAQNTTVKKVKGALEEKNAYLTTNQGDMDLFGCESSPTYNENISRKGEELKTIINTLAKVDNLKPSDLHLIITILSIRVEEIRKECVL